MASSRARAREARDKKAGYHETHAWLAQQLPGISDFDHQAEVLDRIKAEINSACEQYEISPELFWVLVRQQADYELLLMTTTNE